jgi:hypothetical protein
MHPKILLPGSLTRLVIEREFAIIYDCMMLRVALP